jgi:hypothetical protein
MFLREPKMHDMENSLLAMRKWRNSRLIAG